MSEDQLQPEDTLEPGGDPLDEGYSPPDHPRVSQEWGTTANEQRQGETMDQRIRQEETDPNSAYGAPDNNESGLAPVPRSGGDDPDSILAEEDFLGEDRSERDDNAEVGRLVADDEGAREDTDAELDAREAGPDIGGTSPEEAAMHIVDDD